MENTSLTRTVPESEIISFREQFLTFQAKLKSYLYRILTDKVETEDWVHDTFIRASMALPQFEGKSSLKTWVFTIATNLAREKLRHKKRWTADVLAKGKDYAGLQQLMLKCNRAAMGD